MPPDEAFLKETIKVWQPLSAKPLTMADAEEISQAMLGFFEALNRCAREARNPSVQETEKVESLRAS